MRSVVPTTVFIFVTVLALSGPVLASPAHPSSSLSSISPVAAPSPSAHRWRKGPDSMRRAASTPEPAPYPSSRDLSKPSTVRHRRSLIARDTSDSPPPHGPESDPPRFHGDTDVARRTTNDDVSHTLYLRAHPNPPPPHGPENSPPHFAGEAMVARRESKAPLEFYECDDELP